jgi:putative membrane protein
MRCIRVSWMAAVLVIVISMSTGGCSDTQDKRPRSAAQPAGNGGAVGTGGAGANLNDDEFVRDVVLKNMTEAELSRIALEKATNANVKVFAQQMIDDHAAAGDSLKRALSGQPIDWPAQLDEKHRKTVDELRKKDGASFDGDYVKAMVEGHQDLAAKLESRLDVQSLTDWKTAAAGRADSKALPEPNSALRDVRVRPNKSDKPVTMKINQWAADLYPVAQKHLDTARALDSAMKKRSTN